MKLPEKTKQILDSFFRCYRKAAGGDGKILEVFLEQIQKQIETPFQFEPYHKKIRKPFDYYQFGIDFTKPLIDLEKSTLTDTENLTKIRKQLRAGENVVLFANHQTETDPIAISILLEKEFPQLGENMIFVAGERVITDPLAIPFSMGCDLLCIYSKRYIDHPLEKKMEKQLHNKNTMELMSDLLKEGGKIIYVAPSGGRDRKGKNGAVEIAPFDPSSVEMFYLMAKKAKTPTHFYPLMLATFDLLPPPETIQKELGEARVAQRSPVHIHFDKEFDMEHFPGSDEQNKSARRKLRADAIWNIVNVSYQRVK